MADLVLYSYCIVNQVCRYAPSYCLPLRVTLFISLRLPCLFLYTFILSSGTIIYFLLYHIILFDLCYCLRLIYVSFCYTWLVSLLTLSVLYCTLLHVVTHCRALVCVSLLLLCLCWLLHVVSLCAYLSMQQCSCSVLHVYVFKCLLLFLPIVWVLVPWCCLGLCVTSLLRLLAF